MTTPSITHTGYWHMSKTRPQIATAADGTFSVLLFVFDRQGHLQTEGWRVTFAGEAARQWWATEGHTLAAGDTLHMTLSHARTHVLGRFGSAEIHARAKECAIAARAGANGSQDTSHSSAAHMPPHEKLSQLATT